MTWAVRAEITQITFPWKCPCFSLETEVLAYMFVQPCLFTSAGGVSLEVMGQQLKSWLKLPLVRHLFTDLAALT